MVDVKNIVVVGSGLMGNGIAQVSLMAGYNVTLVDIKDEFLDKALANIEKGLKKSESKGQLGEGVTADSLMAKLKRTLDLASAVKDADYTIEAVVENMKVKKEVFKTMAENSPAHCIMATNTSTMSITEIAKDCGRTENVIGMHFFNPVPLMRCIEVIAGEKSSEEAIETGMAVSNSLPCLRGNRYVAKVLKDRPGFIVNRMNAPGQIYLSWVFDQAKEKQISWNQIDADGGHAMPMGPCELCDYVGLDTMHHGMEYYAETLSPNFKPGKVISELVEAGNLGAKTGKGFYDWSGGRPKIDKSQKAGLFDLQTMMAIMLNEGCRILEEGVASGFKIIDDANMAGMNTPGPFGAGKKNFEAWSKLLDKIADKTGAEYLRPCELMKSGGFVKMRK